MHELRICSGVLEIVGVTAGLEPRRLFLSGNNERTDLVEWIYHMCAMWDGPKLVTTPGSDFATLCSLMLEAVDGSPNESLAGAINRYARSDARKQWDREGEGEAEKGNDNFIWDKRVMAVAAEEVALSRRLLEDPNLTTNARMLLQACIQYERQRYEEADRNLGPQQIYPDHMTEQQWKAKTTEEIGLTPDQIEELLPFSSTRAARDIELGRQRRSARDAGVDV